MKHHAKTVQLSPSCTVQDTYVFYIIEKSRYLPDELKKVIDPAIQRNSYFAHPENILLAMMTDERKHIRELAARRLLKARSMANSSIPRLFQVPELNFNAKDYTELIFWKDVTEPPIVKQYTNEDVNLVVQSGGENQLPFVRLPCHTQAVERAVKITTEASISQCTKKSRLGAIKAKLQFRKIMPKFNTKRDFVTE